ncbi:hypothetical protein NW755_010478 [Fusarium falciforme]|uniref:Copper acquisition factor BIM1-like domain-containing protein n=1 Tax=Fusarium falciforme TaxID=195108 RepID=A0A9W8UYJ3_9HYPO|nr:hypothetical protein NW755_010478 [Fusarium falciforme]
MAPTLTSILTLGFLAAAPAFAQTFSDGMGPAAFMWPNDREWKADGDRKAPCGSAAAVGKRTKFPLEEGHLAFVAQHTFYDTKISISFEDDPKSDDDFTALVQDTSIAFLEPGHTCFNIPDPKGKKVGDKATIQFQYQATWNTAKNETFYACADIIYAEADEVSSRVPCFNVTVPGRRDTIPAVESESACTTASAAPAATSADDENLGGKNGLPGTAAAALVVAAAALFAL